MSDEHDVNHGVVAATIARGEMLARRGKYRRAIQIWRELLDSESEEAALADGLIRNKIATTYYRLSRRALRAKGGKPGRKALLRASERLRQALKYEESPEYLIELGHCYLRLGELERADATLTRALEVAPVSERALYYAAVAKLRLGDLERALALIERYPQRSPREGWWRRLRALAVGLSGEIPRALEEVAPLSNIPADVWFGDVVSLVKSISPSPEVMKAYEAVLGVVAEKVGEKRAALLCEIAGDAFACMGRHDQAVHYWADAAEAGENSRALMQKVGLTCENRIVDALRESKLEDAVAWYRLGIELGVGDAIRHLEGIIDFYQGKKAWSQGDYKAAGERFAACLRWRSSADVAMRLAIAHEAQGDWVGAADAWNTVFELSPSDPGQRLEAARRQGIAYIRAGVYDRAALALRRFLEIDVDDEVFLYLGCCLIQMGEWQAAIDLFMRAVEEAGDHPKLLVGLAIATELAGRSLEEQVRAWRRAAHASDEAWVYHIWRRKLLYLARERFNAGNYDQALECYVSLLVEDIDDGESWMWCGAVHLKRGRAENARKCFAAALEATGSAKMALFAGGELLRAGEEEQAHGFFRKAARLDASSATELEIARLCHECGKREPAITHLRRALERWTDGAVHIANISEVAVKVGDAELIRSVMLEALKNSRETAFAQLILAAQEIKLQHWNEAKEALRLVEQAATAANDMAMAADTVFFQKALERAMAFGRLDLTELRAREIALAARWVERHVPSQKPADERAELVAWTRRQLYIAGSLDPADVERVKEGELPIPAAAIPKLMSFDEPLAIHRLLAYEPEWE